MSTALRNRAPWLLFNLCTAATASFVASQFEGTVSQIVILAFLMSIVAGIGGNSGNQTMTLIIRALAMGRITGRNLWQLVKRELFVTLMVDCAAVWWRRCSPGRFRIPSPSPS